jgi:hypothetical protein
MSKFVVSGPNNGEKILEWEVRKWRESEKEDKGKWGFVLCRFTTDSILESAVKPLISVGCLVVGIVGFCTRPFYH